MKIHVFTEDNGRVFVEQVGFKEWIAKTIDNNDIVVAEFRGDDLHEVYSAALIELDYDLYVELMVRKEED